MRVLISVQALRAAAAIAVAICHFNIIEQMMTGTSAQVAELFPLSSGVDLFFVISGFVMVYSSEPFFGTPGAAGSFFFRRLARIAPLYWIVTLISIPLLSQAIDAPKLIASALFFPYRAPSGQIVPLFGPGWTLNYEMMFYLIFAIGINWRRRVAVTGICGGLLLLVIFGLLFQPQFAALVFWTSPIILEFGFGMIVALLLLEGCTLPPSVRLCLIAAGMIAVWLPVPTTMVSSYRVLVWGIPAAAIVAGAVLGKDEPDAGPISGLAKLLGDASYSIYLIHGLVANLIFRFLPRGPRDHLISSPLAVGLIVAIALSIAVFRWFERPLTRSLSSILTRPLYRYDHRESVELMKLNNAE
jgi:exopolysaccharide production protein ExoZ